MLLEIPTAPIKNVVMNICALNYLPFATISLILLLSSCLEEEKSVTLGASVVDKRISMTTYKCEQSKVEVYLINSDAVEGELLAKALNAKGKEIGRAKQNLNLSKDDAKLISFNFDASVNADEVTRYILDFRKR